MSLSRGASDIVKQGYVKVKSKNLGKWNKRWLILRCASSSRAGVPVRLEKYRDESAAYMHTQQPTVFDLVHLEYANRLRDASKFCVYLVFNDYTTLQFAADSDLEAESWYRTIKEEISGDSSRSQNEMFEVYLMKNSVIPASGECLLQVELDAVRILDIEDPRRVHLSWTLNSIRRYSVERGLFVIEVGRASVTGEGIFVFDSKDPDAIYECVCSAARALAAKARHNNSSTCSPNMMSLSTQTNKNNNCYNNNNDSTARSGKLSNTGGPFSPGHSQYSVTNRNRYGNTEAGSQNPPEYTPHGYSGSALGPTSMSAGSQCRSTRQTESPATGHHIITSGSTSSSRHQQYSSTDDCRPTGSEYYSVTGGRGKVAGGPASSRQFCSNNLTSAEGSVTSSASASSRCKQSPVGSKNGSASSETDECYNTSEEYSEGRSAGTDYMPSTERVATKARGETAGQLNRPSPTSHNVHTTGGRGATGVTGDYELATAFEDDAQESQFRGSRNQYSGTQHSATGAGVSVAIGCDGYEEPIPVGCSTRNPTGRGRMPGVNIGVGSDAHYEQPLPVKSAMKRTQTQGTTTQPTYEEITNDPKDQELTRAIRQELDDMGLGSMYVERLELI